MLVGWEGDGRGGVGWVVGVGRGVIGWVVGVLGLGGGGLVGRERE